MSTVSHSTTALKTLKDGPPVPGFDTVHSPGLPRSVDQEVLRHAPMVQNGPDGRGLRGGLLEDQVPELSTSPTISRYSILGGAP
jgi:hypothetical protein